MWPITNLNLSSLVIGDVKKELLSYHPSEAMTENVMEEAVTTAKVMEEAATTTSADPIPNEQSFICCCCFFFFFNSFFSFLFFFFGKIKTISFMGSLF